MQWWVVTGAWAFAVLLAIVLLGFAGYELAWKARRLAADRAKLDRTVADLAEVAGQLRAVADRAAALRPMTATHGPVEPGASGSTEPALE